MRLMRTKFLLTSECDIAARVQPALADSTVANAPKTSFALPLAQRWLPIQNPSLTTCPVTSGDCVVASDEAQSAQRPPWTSQIPGPELGANGTKDVVAVALSINHAPVRTSRTAFASSQRVPRTASINQ